MIEDMSERIFSENTRDDQIRNVRAFAAPRHREQAYYIDYQNQRLA
jgi:hypothetical protein